jgi:hypothetical protein
MGSSFGHDDWTGTLDSWYVIVSALDIVISSLGSIQAMREIWSICLGHLGAYGLVTLVRLHP